MLFKHIVYSNIQNGRHVATTVRSSVTEPRDWAAVERPADFSIFSMAVDLYTSILNSFSATFINQTWVSDGFAKPLHASV